jgi:3-hydroxybutyryl-CoA dehydratase
MSESPDVRTDFQISEKASITKEIKDEDIESYADITGDRNPLHLDDAFASTTRFKGRIAHGLLSAGLISAVLGMKLPGPGAIYLSQSLNFVAPVRPGDTLTAEVEVAEWKETKKIIRLKTRCYNQEGTDILHGEAVLLVEPPSVAS